MSGKFYTRILVLAGAMIAPVSAGEEIWYNASGEVVKVAQAEDVKLRSKLQGLSSINQTYYSPASDVIRASSHENGIRRTRTVYSYPYFVRPGYQYGYYNRYTPHRSSKSLLRINYQGNGWSLRYNH